MIQLDDIAISPNVLLAPMAGITDRPYREMVARFGAGLVVSEMVACAEMVAATPSARARAEIAAGRSGTSVQIAGHDADLMAEAARIAVGQGARIIDINMGCPARRVTSGAAGSALMRDPDHALSLIEAVVGAVEVPVTLKMRLGWDHDDLNAPLIARRAEAAGVRMLTVHGRTRCQFYKGEADWSAIRATVDAVAIPVIANGDIVSAATASRALALSGAAGVMVGRGAIGRPWLLAEIAAGMAGQKRDMRPRGGDYADLIATHCDAHLAFYGREVGVRAMRKHLDAYLAEVPGAGHLRGEILRETDTRPLFGMISQIGALDTPALAA